MRIQTHGRDWHRRLLGTVFHKDVNMYPKDTMLKQFEEEAKKAKKGGKEGCNLCAKILDD